MDPTITDLTIDTTGSTGFNYNGSHDVHAANIMVIDAGINTTNTYPGFYIGVYGNGRWFNCHAWTRSTTTQRMTYAFDVQAGGNEFVGCHFEGAYTALLRIGGQANTFSACRWYNAWNGVSIIVKSPYNRIDGFLDGPDVALGRPDAKGLIMGESGDNCAVNFVTLVTNNLKAGVIDFTYSNGYHNIQLQGYNASGTNVVGTAAATDTYDIVISNPGAGDTTLHGKYGNLAVGGLIRPKSYTVAGLPAGTAGDMAYASNGRKNGEGAGAGTGVLVFKDGTAWRACDTGATVAA
jgi:hypothetical protein